MKLDINPEELTYFIVKSKKNCYAGNGSEQILPDGSKLLTFQEGNLWYEDNYSGYDQSPGEGRELVRWQGPEGQRIWQMSYFGGIENRFLENKEVTEETFSFLKKMLSRVTPENPFKGPIKTTIDKPWVYFNSVNGDIFRFKGNESISKEGLGKTFSQDYIGGLIIPK